MARRPKKQPRVDLSSEPLPSDQPIDTKKEELSGDEAILKQMAERLNRGWDFWEETYQLSREDVNFVYDDQWPEYAKKGRQNRPQLTMNQLPHFAQQVTNNARQSRFSIQVRQLSGKNTPIMDAKASKSYSRAQIMEGLIRDIEVRSKARDAIGRACQHQVEGAFSWFLVKTRQCFEDPFDIELAIEHIEDRYSAMIDPMSRRVDDSDAQWCANWVDVPTEEFKIRWPEIPAQDWNSAEVQRFRQSDGVYWSGDRDNTRVVDYWWKEPMERVALEYVREIDTQLERLVMFEDEVEDVLDELKFEGYIERQRKEIDGYKVKYARCTASHILDGQQGGHDWPSMHLPLVMVKGREVNLDTKKIIISLFRYAHDPQRMVNFWSSAATEKMALVPRQPYIAAAEQVANHLDDWEKMYEANKPVLLYDYIPDLPPPQRQNTTAMAQGELAMVGQSKIFLMDAVGIHDASLGRRSNEVSGRAVEARQEQGDRGTYDFIDNLGKAYTRVGDILVDMIPRVYTTDFVRRAIMPDDSELMVDLNKVVRDEESGQDIRVFSLDFARYSCRVELGPESKTQREEFVKMMIEWGRSDPEGFAAFRDLIVQNMDIPMARVVAQRMKAMVPRELLSPEEQEQLPEPEPTPADQIEMMKAEAEQMKAQAEMKKAEAMMAQAEMRSVGDQARLGHEIQKGENRTIEQRLKIAEQQLKTMEAQAKAAGAGEGDGDVEGKIKREVAKQMAAYRAKNPRKSS